MKKQTHTVAVKEHWLSDGNAVYSVELSEYGPHDCTTRMNFDAITRGLGICRKTRSTS